LLLIISRPDSLHEENPKLYWNIVNELQGKSEKSGSCAVPSSTLVSHFKTLSELKSEFDLTNKSGFFLLPGILEIFNIFFHN
jgi:hypothetical protein